MHDLTASAHKADAAPQEQSALPQPPSIETSPDPVAYAAALLSEAREEIGRADNKASILLAAAGVAAGAILAGMLSSGWQPADLGEPSAFLWWVGAVVAAAGVVALVACIYPRMAPSSTHEARHLFYFAHVHAYESTEALKAALVESAHNPLDRNAHQLFHLSRIVRTKYALLRLAIWLLLAAAILCGVAAVRLL